MERKECRYFFTMPNTTLCQRDNVKNPNCKGCDVDKEPDIIYNNVKFHKLAKDTSPKGAELMLDFVKEVAGGLNASETPER